MRFKWALAGLAFTLALPVSIAMAGAFEDGVTAYERQDYATALGLFQPLADKGDASAQFNIGSMYAYGEGFAGRLIRAMPLLSSTSVPCTPRVLALHRTIQKPRGGIVRRPIKATP